MVNIKRGSGERTRADEIVRGQTYETNSQPRPCYGPRPPAAWVAAGRELQNEVSAPDSGRGPSLSGRNVGCPAGISKRTRRPGAAEGAHPSAAGSAAGRKERNEPGPPRAQRRSPLAPPEFRTKLPPPPPTPPPAPHY